MAWIYLFVRAIEFSGTALLMGRRYVRMIGSPALYNVGADYLEGDPALIQKRGKSVST